MPRKSLAQRLSELKGSVEHAAYTRDLNVEAWDEAMEFYRTRGPGLVKRGQEDIQVQINLVFAWFESIWPTLTYKNPHWACSPENDSAATSAPTVEAAVNNELRVRGFKRNYKKGVFDALLKGVGILQVGYHDGGLVYQHGASGDDERGSLEKDPSDSDLPYGFTPKSLYIRHHSPRNFLIDPNATCLDDALWCGVEYVRPVGSVKSDPQYKHTETLDADAYTLPPHMTVTQYQEHFEKDPEMDMVRLIQIWDITERRVHVINLNHGQFLLSEDWELPVTRFPFYTMHGTEDVDKFWNQAPIVPWLDLVAELNDAETERADFVSRNKPKVLFNANAITGQNVQALLESRNLAAIKVEGLDPNGDVRGALASAPMAQMGPEHWAHLAEIKQRYTEVSGTSEFDTGGTRPGERPAAEINRIGAGSDIRRFGLGSRIVGGLDLLPHDTRRIMSRYYKDERVARIVGEFGRFEWVEYKGSDLEGQYDFSFTLEDLAPKTTEEKRQAAGIALQMFTPFSQVGSPTPRIDIDPFLRKAAEALGYGQEITFFPQGSVQRSPEEEFFLMVGKNMDLDPHPADRHDHHIWLHESQLQHQLVAANPHAVMRLKSHIETHRAYLEGQELSVEANQQQQGPGQPAQATAAPGTPGPQPGGPSNNESGGAGPFSGDQGMTAGSPEGVNMPAMLRGS